MFANTKSQKIHGYALAKLMLGFSPQMKHFDVEWEPPTEADLKIEDTTKHQRHIYMVLRDENCCLASEASAYSHYRRGQQERRQRIPKADDLVLVRNHAVDGQRVRKLESKCLGPRLLVSLSSSGLTGRVRELCGAGGTKKYHLNDLILYVERKDFEICEVKVLQPGMGTRALILRSRWEKRARGEWEIDYGGDNQEHLLGMHLLRRRNDQGGELAGAHASKSTRTLSFFSKWRRLKDGKESQLMTSWNFGFLS